MFSHKINAQDFKRTMEALVAASENAKPATLHTSAKRILERCQGYTGSDIDGLLNHIVNSPKAAKRVAAKPKKSKAPVSKPTSAQINDVVVALQKVEGDKADFERLVAQYGKNCSADLLKAVAATYAASSKPRTKGAALELLILERGNKVRAEKKHNVSGEARPW